MCMRDNCTSDRIISISAKCSDLFSIPDINPSEISPEGRSPSDFRKNAIHVFNFISVFFGIFGIFITEYMAFPIPSGLFRRTNQFYIVIVR